MERLYSDTLVIWLATAVAVLDVLFILVAVPESLPEKLRPASWGSQISWEKADPFGVSIFQFLSMSPEGCFKSNLLIQNNKDWYIGEKIRLQVIKG